MKNLHLYATDELDELASPEDSSTYSLETPAMEFISDFNVTKPMAIDSRTKAHDIQALMLNLHVSLISIVDSKGHFIGIVSLDDLSDQNLIRKQAEGFYPNEIEAVDFMTPRKDLLAFDSEEIENATIGEVIETLKTTSHKECLVLDRYSHKIRGIFTIGEISKKLHQPIEIRDQSSFYRFFALAPFNSAGLRMKT